MQILVAAPNRFKGIEIDPDALPKDPEEFRDRLELSLSEWEAEAYKLIWLNIPIDTANLIPVATEAGFTFHHAHEDYLLLTKRLVDDALVPGYATHYIGAGGVVLNGIVGFLSECAGVQKLPCARLRGVYARHARTHAHVCVRVRVCAHTPHRTIVGVCA